MGISRALLPTRTVCSGAPQKRPMRLPRHAAEYSNASGPRTTLSPEPPAHTAPRGAASHPPARATWLRQVRANRQRLVVGRPHRVLLEQALRRAFSWPRRQNDRWGQYSSRGAMGPILAIRWELTSRLRARSASSPSNFAGGKSLTLGAVLHIIEYAGLCNRWSLVFSTGRLCP